MYLAPPPPVWLKCPLRHRSLFSSLISLSRILDPHTQGRHADRLLFYQKAPPIHHFLAIACLPHTRSQIVILEIHVSAFPFASLHTPQLLSLASQVQAHFFELCRRVIVRSIVHHCPFSRIPLTRNLASSQPCFITGATSSSKKYLRFTPVQQRVFLCYYQPRSVKVLPYVPRLSTNDAADRSRSSNEIQIVPPLKKITAALAAAPALFTRAIRSGRCSIFRRCLCSVGS
jgi:hypothetical protein